MAYERRAYCEHVAIFVKDIDWHVAFFRDALGMTLRDASGGTGGAPRQAWTIGGIQLVADPDFDGHEGRCAHLGIMVEDREAAIRECLARGARALPKGPNWLVTPDGLGIEILQASGDSVARALAVDPRT